MLLYFNLCNTSPILLHFFLQPNEGRDIYIHIRPSHYLLDIGMKIMFTLSLSIVSSVCRPSLHFPHVHATIYGFSLYFILHFSQAQKRKLGLLEDDGISKSAETSGQNSRDRKGSKQSTRGGNNLGIVDANIIKYILLEDDFSP